MNYSYSKIVLEYVSFMPSHQNTVCKSSLEPEAGTHCKDMLILHCKKFI